MTPCRYKAKCNKFDGGGKCEQWHVFEEMQALKKKYRDALGIRDGAVIDGARGGKGKQRKGQGKGAAGGCNNYGWMDHWIRDCDKAGAKIRRTLLLR